MLIQMRGAMFKREGWKRLYGVGLLLLFAVVVFQHDLFPDSKRFGHWFWISMSGFVLFLIGELGYIVSRPKEKD